MATYDVTIKNISVNVKGMRLGKGETTTIKVVANDDYHAKQVATQRLFDGCHFYSEGQYGTDGTLIGCATTGRNLYGRMWVYSEQTERSAKANASATE